MDMAELKRFINLGSLPITVFRKPFLGNIDIVIRLTKGNCVFLDYENRENGEMRITLEYDSFDKMIEAIEKYVGGDTDLYKIYLDRPEDKETNLEDWSKLQEYVYEHKIDLLDNYKTLIIGSAYWEGLYLNEISPSCSDDEYMAWIKRSGRYYSSKDDEEYNDDE